MHSTSKVADFPTPKIVNINDFEKSAPDAKGRCQIKYKGKDYYFKPGVGALDAFSGELYRFALGPDAITEMLTVVDDTGRAVGILSEKITNGIEFTKTKTKFPNLSPMDAKAKLDLQLGRFCAALQALDEQDSNFDNIFVREVGKGEYRFSIIDVEHSLGQVYSRKEHPIQNANELNNPILLLHADTQALASSVMGTFFKPSLPAHQSAFKEQAYFVYLALALLNEDALSSLANDHYRKDEATQKLAVEKGSQFIGERLRDILMGNKGFVEWLTNNKTSIEAELLRHVTAFNKYKEKENPTKYPVGLISSDKVSEVLNGMINTLSKQDKPTLYQQEGSTFRKKG